ARACTPAVPSVRPEPGPERPATESQARKTRRRGLVRPRFLRFGPSRGPSGPRRSRKRGRPEGEGLYARGSFGSARAGARAARDGVASAEDPKARACTPAVPSVRPEPGPERPATESQARKTRRRGLVRPRFLRFGPSRGPSGPRRSRKRGRPEGEGLYARGSFGSARAGARAARDGVASAEDPKARACTPAVPSVRPEPGPERPATESQARKTRRRGLVRPRFLRFGPSRGPSGPRRSRKRGRPEGEG